MFHQSFNIFFIQVCEKLEKNTVEDAVKQILEEEDTNKDQTTLLTETMEEKSKEENTGVIMSIQEVNRLYDSLISN